MQITSHFIGIKIKNKAFIDLFATLQRYVTYNDLDSVIELQNIHSLHVSLYYLPQEISTQELYAIKNTLASLNMLYKDFIVTQDRICYFKKEDIDYLAYIACSHVKQLQALNRQLANQYKKDYITDNQYEYIPHISLFRIVNHKVFLFHRNNIDTLVMQALRTLTDKNLFLGFHLYGVNAKFHPEMQFVVESF